MRIDWVEAQILGLIESSTPEARISCGNADASVFSHQACLGLVFFHLITIGFPWMDFLDAFETELHKNAIFPLPQAVKIHEKMDTVSTALAGKEDDETL